MNVTEAAKEDPDKACRACKGTGTKYVPEFDGAGYRTMVSRCDECFGTGSREVKVFDRQIKNLPTGDAA